MLKRRVQFPVDAPQLSPFANLTANIETVAGLRLDYPHHPRTRRYHRRVLARGAGGRADNRTVTGCRRESRPSFIASYIRHLIHRPEPPFQSVSSSKFKTTLELCPSVTLAPQTDSVVDNPPLAGVTRHGNTTWPPGGVTESLLCSSCGDFIYLSIYLSILWNTH